MEKNKKDPLGGSYEKSHKYVCELGRCTVAVPKIAAKKPRLHRGEQSFRAAASAEA